MTEGFFPTLARAARARPRLPPEDDRAGAAARGDHLSDGFWRRRFGADPAIVGQSITFNARARSPSSACCRRLSVTSRSIPSAAADIFTPSGFDPAQANRGGHFIRGVARLEGRRRRSSRRAPSSTPLPRASSSSIRADNTNQGVHRRHRCSIRWSASRGRCVLLLAGAVDRRAARGVRQRRQPAARARHRAACASWRCAPRSARIAAG